jgi:AAA-like domain/Bacterial regulatory proteins, luxR family
MKATDFNAILDSLTPRQRQVLQHFLAGESDEAIAALLHLETTTIRRHLANVCREFGLSNAEGEHYSYREHLITLFTQFKPDWVTLHLLNASPVDTEFPGSPLSVESLFYVERPPIEAQCAKELLKPGALIRIRAPQRMGKTSLLKRLMAKAESLGYRAIRLDLRQAETSVLTDLDTFLRWFCLNVSRLLNLSLPLETYWDGDRFGALVSCTTYFQAAILGTLPQPVLLGLDGIDGLFEVPQIAQGFFALLRSWHEEANNLEVWQRLRLVVVHSTEVYIPLNVKQSPFNVGLPIRLPELTRSQVQSLARQYGLQKFTSHDGDRLVTLISGHPYLVQLALYQLGQQVMTLDELLHTAPTQAGIYRHHLQQHWQRLQDHPELLDALQHVLTAGTAGVTLEPTLAYKLESLGLIYLQNNNAIISCDLYQQYFTTYFTTYFMTAERIL